MNLIDAEEGKKYIISKIKTGDMMLEAFLLSLGCYVGEEICVVLRNKNSLIVSIKESRYSMDTKLASAIFIV